MSKELSRRECLAVGLGIVNASSLLGHTAAPVRVGLIGLGARSTRHLAALKNIDGSIAALCDIESERTTRVNAGLPAKAEAYTDYREMIRDKKVDAVVVITPPYLHFEMVMAALAAGKDVLVEKPLGLNWQQVQQIVRAANRSGRVVAVGLQKRYTHTDTQMLAAVENGRIGKLRLVTYEEYRGDWNPRTTKFTDPATGKQASWRLMKKACGSAELEFSVHAFATVCSLVKSPLARLTASGGAVHYTDGRETRDLSSFVADFGNGVRFDYSFSCFAPDNITTCMLLGDRGMIKRDGDVVTISSPGGKFAPISDTPAPAERAEEMMYREFFEDIRAHKPSPLKPEVALEPSKIAFALDISIAQNRIVTAADFPVGE